MASHIPLLKFSFLPGSRMGLCSISPKAVAEMRLFTPLGRVYLHSTELWLLSARVFVPCSGVLPY